MLFISVLEKSSHLKYLVRILHGILTRYTYLETTLFYQFFHKTYFPRFTPTRTIRIAQTHIDFTANRYRKTVFYQTSYIQWDELSLQDKTGNWQVWTRIFFTFPRVLCDSRQFFFFFAWSKGLVHTAIEVNSRLLSMNETFMIEKN